MEIIRSTVRWLYGSVRSFSRILTTYSKVSLSVLLSLFSRAHTRASHNLALKHPEVPLLALHLLMKALQEVRRPDEPPERLGKRDRQLEGLVKIDQKLVTASGAQSARACRNTSARSRIYGSLLIAGDTLPGQRSVTSAQCGHMPVGNRAVLHEQGALIAPAAGRLGWTPPGYRFIAIQPRRGVQFFF
jgi:hypothetical protein